MKLRFLLVPSLVFSAHAAVITLSSRITRRFGIESLSHALPWVPRWLRWVSAVFDFSSGVLLYLSAIGRLRLPRAMGEAGPLETGGVYRYVRHPLYTGVVLIYSGLGWLTNRTAFTIGALLWFVVFQFVARHEERHMLWRHGETYRRYHEQRPGFIPDMDRLVQDLKQCRIASKG